MDETREDAVAADSPFFMPDLCQTQSVLLLILIAELLVFVLVIADAGFAGFSWSQLGLTSLYVQWLALSSAGLLCLSRPWLASLSLPLATSLAYGVVLLLTLAFSLISNWVLTDAETAWSSMEYGRILDHLLISGIITGLIFRYLYLQNEYNRQRHAELQSRIQALQSNSSATAR